MEHHKSVFWDRTHFNLASNKRLTKNVILWSYSNLSFCSGRQIVDTVYSSKQGSSYQIRNYKFIHLYIYKSMKLGSFVWGKQEGNLFVLSENVHFSQHRQESGVITRQSPSLCEWGEKMSVCRTLGRKLFDHILMRKLLEAGTFFCLYFLLWFLCRFFILHSSPLQLCLHIILICSSLSCHELFHSLFRCDSDEISRDLQQKKKEISEMNWKSLPIFRPFFPASSFELLLYTEICWMTHWPKIQFPTRHSSIVYSSK